jgi:hypothetical protein
MIGTGASASASASAGAGAGAGNFSLDVSFGDVGPASSPGPADMLSPAATPSAVPPTPTDWSYLFRATNTVRRRDGRTQDLFAVVETVVPGGTASPADVIAFSSFCMSRMALVAADFQAAVTSWCVAGGRGGVG